MWLGLAAVLWYMTGSGLFLLLLLGAAYRVFLKKDHASSADQAVMFQFAGLMVLFGAILMMRN